MKVFATKTCVKVQPTYSVVYRKFLEAYNRKISLIPLLNKHDGSVSDKAAARIRNSVNWMLYFTKKKFVYSRKERSTFSFYLNFITLTLPARQVHSDEFIKSNMLIPFIEWMKEKHCATMYLWKAESQANGNIHFHISTHVFIHWKEIRWKWNRICATHGYCKIFQDGSNDLGDSATQVKAAKSPEHVGGYLAGYIGKKDKVKYKVRLPKGLPQPFKTKKFSDSATNYYYGIGSVLKRPIEGRLWACSQNISNINVQIDEEERTADEFDDILKDVLQITERTITDKYYNVLLYSHLCLGNIPTHIRYAIESATPIFYEKTNYRVESFLN